MNKYTGGRTFTREAILDLLSDDETAKVSNAVRASLVEGDEYLDLAAIEKGVQLIDGVAVNMGGMIPRKAILERTWREIL
ncbi:MAG: hypothetical protein R3A48_05430 [Polyangiales bacterium]